MIVKGENVVEIRSVEAGELLCRIPVPCQWFEKIHVSPRDQALIIGRNLREPENDRHWPLNWLDRLIGKRRGRDLLTVWSLESHEEILQISDFTMRDPALAPDGKSLLLVQPRGDLEVPDRLVCWDLPPRRPWGWIIGVPAGIGVSVLAWNWLRRKRRVA